MSWSYPLMNFFCSSREQYRVGWVFFTVKAAAPLCSDTQRHSFKEHYFTFLSCFAFLAQREILVCKMLLAFNVNCLGTGFPNLFEFSQKLTSKCSTGSKAVISPQGISWLWHCNVDPDKSVP